MHSFASQIADTVRKYHLENNDDWMNMPRTDHDSDNIEHFAQVVLLWTTGWSRGEILQRVKYQHKTKQFMFVTGELEAERLEAERLEAERLEAERIEAKRLEAERLRG